MFETARLNLREWREEDFAPFADLNADPLVMEYFPACLTRSESDDLANRMIAHYDRHGFGPMALERKDTGAFIGFTGLIALTDDLPMAPGVEIGWRLAHDQWGQGLAGEAARFMITYGFMDLELSEIVAFTATGNKRSMRVMEKIGMARDAQGDFQHPRVAEGDPLRPHVLYRIRP